MPQNINIARLIFTVFSCISVLVSVHISSLYVFVVFPFVIFSFYVYLSDGLIEWKEFDLVRIPRITPSRLCLLLADQLPNVEKQRNRKTILADSHRKHSPQCIDCGSKPVVPKLFVTNDNTQLHATPSQDNSTSYQSLSNE